MNNKKVIFVIALVTLFSFSVGNNANCQDKTLIKDKSVIVELKDDLGDSIDGRKIVKQEFIHLLNSELNFNYDIISSVSNVGNVLVLNIPSNYYNKLSSIELVKSVSVNNRYNPKYSLENYNPFNSKIAPDKNYSRVDMNIINSKNEGAGSFVAILDNSFNINHEMFKNIDGNLRYSKSMISSLKSHDGFIAKNAGYKDDKIPFYYNYGNNDLNMTFTSNTNYHGAHVSGITGANNSIIGAAPNAQLALMKVTDNNGNFQDSSIISALNDCSWLNVDALNMSFGNSIYDYSLSNVMTDLFANLKNKGIQINVANGNDGRESYELTAYQNFLTSDVENGILGQFAGSDLTNSVGSLTVLKDNTITSSLSTYSGTNFRIREQIVDHTYIDNNVSKIKTYNVIHPFYSLIPIGSSSTIIDYELVPNNGDLNDYSSISVKNKIAVISRGSISFVDKIRNAVTNGAIGIIVYNSENSTDQVGYMNLETLEDKYLVPVAYIKSSDGVLLNSQEIKKIRINKELASDFSSDGSTSDLKLKPDLSAPGSNIYSGIGPEINDYIYYSGTSMATPNLTGVMANLISNQTFNSKEERIAYRKSLMLRLMSTSTPLMEASGAYYSPRKVGSGRVNFDNALNSSVYLEGNVNEKAKVELKNSDDIKDGNISFSLKTHNESSQAKKYNAKLVIQAPELTKLDHVYGEFSNYNYMTDKDVLLSESTNQITIPVGASSIDFSASIDSYAKDYLKNFVNGTFLEGYVILTSLDDSHDLVVPYMGFYGDYNSEEVLEPFNFERKDSTVYGSDLIGLLSKDYNLVNADFGSYINGSDSEITSGMYNGIVKNTTNIKEYGNILNYDKNNDYLKVGLSGYSTHLFLQSFVNRNCIDNSISLVNKSTNKTVYKGYFNNYLDNNSSYSKHYLVKSIATPDLLSSQSVANRAYAKINLVDNNNNLLFEEGLYTLKFDFTLVNGLTQEKSYNLNLINVDKNEPPVILSRETINQLDGNYIRIRFIGNTIDKVYANRKSVDYLQDQKSYYIDLKIDDYSSENNLFISFVDIYDKKSFYIIDMATISSDGFGLISNELVYGNTLTASKSDKSIDDQGYIYYYSYLIKDSNNANVILTNDFQVTFKVPVSYVSEKDKIKVFDSNSNGTSFGLTNFSLYDGVITATTRSGYLKVIYLETTDIIDVNEGLSNGVVIGLIIGGAAVLIGVLGAVLILRSLRKHH